MALASMHHQCGVRLAGAVLTVSALMSPAAANAAPVPCSVSAVAAATGAVATAVSGYLNQHPDVDRDLTDMAKLPPIEARAAYRGYFAEHPEVARDLRALRGPLGGMDQCGFEIAPSQLIAALETL